MKKGTIDLAEGLYLPSASGEKAFRPIITIQMTSADLSAETAWNLQLSAGDDVWAQATDTAGEDIAGTLAANTTKIVTWELDNSLLYRIVFAAGNTGSVAYIIMQ